MLNRIRENIVQFILHIFWIAILIGPTLYICGLPREKSVERGQNASLRVYNKTNEAYDCDADPSCGYRELGAEKAVQFGLEQLVNRIDYFLAAAIAALAFISKLVLDPLLDTNKAKPLHRRTLFFFWHSAIGFGISLFYGVFASQFLPEIATYQYFSINGYVGVAACCQLIIFILALVLFIGAIVSIIYPNLKRQEGK